MVIFGVEALAVDSGSELMLICSANKCVAVATRQKKVPASQR
jgi:hypothetical protein